MPTIDLHRRFAIAELLAQPDPPELHGRGHHLRLQGKPSRYDLLPSLAAVFVQKNLLAIQERRSESVPIKPIERKNAA